MKKELVVFNEEVALWLKSLGQHQAMFCVNNIVKILSFAKKK